MTGKEKADLLCGSIFPYLAAALVVALLASCATKPPSHEATQSLSSSATCSPEPVWLRTNDRVVLESRFEQTCLSRYRCLEDHSFMVAHKAGRLGPIELQCVTGLAQ